MRTALIDADEIKYKIALRYQKIWWCTTLDNKVLHSFPTKIEAIESIGNNQDLDIIQEIEALPPDGMEELLDTLISGILLETNSTDFRLYLSGEENFRYKLATLVPYKGNRVNENKPIYLEYVKGLIRARGSEEISFLEADDLLSSGIRLFKDCVICSQDKDLRTVPSLNFNTGPSRLLQTITPKKARYNFFKQLLIGDPVDNIPSPYNLGEVGATKFLDGLMEGDEHYYYQHLVPFYQKWLNTRDKEGSFKTKWYRDDMDIHDILFEIGNLLFMRRTRDESERWNVPLDFKANV
jgi:hypothetical protein